MVYFEIIWVSALLPLLQNISLKKWNACESSLLLSCFHDLQNLNHFRFFFKLSL